MNPNFPSEFCNQMAELLDAPEYDRFLSAMSAETPVSVRLNPVKRTAFDLGWSDGVRVSAVPWCAEGSYLDERPAFTFDPLFHAGCYYVQEASSMFLEQVIRRYVSGSVLALDLCAAPGGKSTHLRSLLDKDSLLVANEVIRPRAQVLVENLVKWGYAGTVVTHNDPADFTEPLTEAFDLMVVDAPCSGEGMFRKDEGAVSEWSRANVQLCQERQRRILSDIWPCLRPGGILVYSTCTFNREEDEDNVQWLVDTFQAEPLPVEVPGEWGVTTDLTGRGLPVYRFLPHRTAGEGFFLCAVRKPGDEPARTYIPKKCKQTPRRQEIPAEVKRWVALSDDCVWQQTEVGATALPTSWAGLIAYLQANLRVSYAGIEVAVLKGKDWMPAHGLAMSTACRTDAFACCEVDQSVAWAYLRREALTLPAGIPRGYVLLTYHRVPLGFVKNLGPRANNLYPHEWRIRSPYAPDVLSSVLR